MIGYKDQHYFNIGKEKDNDNKNNIDKIYNGFMFNNNFKQNQIKRQKYLHTLPIGLNNVFLEPLIISQD